MAEVASTQEEVARAARLGEEAGLVVVAGHQSAGRGRSGRTWVDQPGRSLLCSCLLRPRLERSRLFLVGFAAGLSASDACRAASGATVVLKWPNDLLIGELKLGGVLAETLSGPAGDAVVVGLGVNLAGPLPAEVATQAIALGDAGEVAVPAEALLHAYLEALSGWLGVLQAPAREDEVLVEYRRRCSTLGGWVRVSLPGGSALEGRAVEGRAVGIADDGRLSVDVVGGPTQAFSAGEVTHLRSRPGPP
jgi:BirA family transcriptional regulator, biotin operon repressor / biotin---[acetyl-CoA-carboxylase] ligase